MAIVGSLAPTLEAGVVRILASDGRQAVGGGILIGDREVVTCAHVVATALGWQGGAAAPLGHEVLLDFPIVAPGETLQATVAMWHPSQPDGSGDIAGLLLEQALPADAHPSRLVNAAELWNHPFRAFGFPPLRDQGVWVSGLLRALQAGGWIQADVGSTAGYRVEQGFSGAAVWDDRLAAVVGMMVASEAPGGPPSAYLIPTSTLSAAWPAVAEQSLPACPYRGLYAFAEQDAHLFYGRDDLSTRLADELSARPLITVVGPSGSGKSSLVFAGAVAKLRRRGGWEVASMRPAAGRSPLTALATALVPLLEVDLSETQRLQQIPALEEVLRDGRLGEVVGRILKRRGARRFLLVVDQLEELYSLAPAVVRQFTQILVQAATGRPPDQTTALTVLLTLRGDFLSAALEQAELAEAVQGSVVVVGGMSRAQLRNVIERPAEGKVRYAEGLVDRILDDVGTTPGSLPLLEFALTLLWERQAGGSIGHVAYEELGGADGALARYAEQVYLNELQGADREAARRVLLQLVRPGEGTEHTRRVARRTDLDEERWQIAQRLAATRLVVTGQDAAGVQTVEVVHEALITRWERLRTWIEEDRAFRAWQERLRMAVEQWETTHHDQGALLRGAPLADAERWLEERPEDLSPVEREFVRASRALQDQELIDARRRNRSLRNLAAGLAVLVLVSLTLGGVAVWQREQTRSEERRAREQRLLATSRYLAAEAAQRSGSQPVLSALLGVAAFREADTVEARSRMLHEVGLRRGVLGYLTGHTSTVTAVTSDPRGDLLASASADGTVLLWDGTRRTLLARLAASAAGVRSLAVSPDGATLAVGDFDGKLEIWDLRARRRIDSFQGHRRAVMGVAFNRQGDILASASLDHTVAIWDVRRRRRLRVLRAHRAPVMSVAYSPDGATLATGAEDRRVILWDAERLLPRRELGQDDKVRTIAFSRDGRRLAVGGSDRAIALWDLSRSRRIGRLRGHSDRITQVLFSPDGGTLASASADDTAIVWDAVRGSLIRRFKGHTNVVTGLAFSNDSRTLVSGSADRTVVLWNLREELPALTGHGDLITSVAYSPDGRTLASASFDQTVALWDTARRTRIRTLTGHRGVVIAVAFSPDGQRLASASDDRTVELWQVATGTRAGVLSGHPGGLTAVAFSPNGALLATADDAGTIALWDAARQTRSRTLQAQGPPVAGLAFSPDGQILATASVDRSIGIWNVDTGARIASLRGHNLDVWSVAFSPDGHRLASASDDGTVMLWSVDQRVRLATLESDQLPVYAIAFSPDGKTLASTSKDGAVRLWDIDRESLLGTLRAHTGEVHAVAFSKDGRVLASAGADKRIILWDVAAPSWARRLCALAGRSLTRTEWSEFLPSERYRSICA